MNKTAVAKFATKTVHTCKTDLHDFKANVFSFAVTVRPHN